MAAVLAYCGLGELPVYAFAVPGFVSQLHWFVLVSYYAWSTSLTYLPLSLTVNVNKDSSTRLPYPSLYLCFSDTLQHISNRLILSKRTKLEIRFKICASLILAQAKVNVTDMPTSIQPL